MSRAEWTAHEPRSAQDALRGSGRAPGDVADHGDGRGGPGAEADACGDDPPANRTDDSGAPFRNWFDVLINGHLAVTIIASPDRTRYEIPRPLGNGPHTISVFKRTEAVVGVCTFLGQFMADLPDVGQDVAFTQSQEVVQFGNPVLHVHGAVATGLPWSCGDFRHTFGSQLAQKGESLYKIATLMGNSPDICRRHYAALIPEEMHDTVEFAKPNGDENPPKDKTQALLEEVLKRLDEKTQPDADSVGAGEGDPPSSKPKPGARKPMTRIPWGHGLQNTN